MMQTVAYLKRSAMICATVGFLAGCGGGGAIGPTGLSGQHDSTMGSATLPISQVAAGYMTFITVLDPAGKPIKGAATSLWAGDTLCGAFNPKQKPVALGETGVKGGAWMTVPSKTERFELGIVWKQGHWSACYGPLLQPPFPDKLTYQFEE